MKIEAWFDGCCEPVNPGGYAAWGALVKIDGAKVWEDGMLVGNGPAMSNNVAEYSGCLAAMRFINAHLGNQLAPTLHVRGDSKLVINQLNRSWNLNCTRCKKPLRYDCGVWKCRGCAEPKPGLYFPYYLEAAQELVILQTKIKTIRWIWIPRDENSECDRLSKGVLLDMGIKFRIQPEEGKNETVSGQ